MEQVLQSDKDKIVDDYHNYAKIVREARSDIDKHLYLLRQREADQTGGARAKVPDAATNQKKEEPPRQKEPDRYFSDDHARKDKNVDWKEERRLQAELYREFEMKKLLEDQKKEFENRMKQALAKKDLELEAQRKASKGVTFQTPNPFPEEKKEKGTN